MTPASRAKSKLCTLVQVWLLTLVVSISLLASGRTSEAITLPSDDCERTIRRAHYLMGTLFEIVACAGRNETAVTDAVEQAFQRIRELQETFSTYSDSSEVTRANQRLQKGSAVKLNETVFSLLEESLRLSHLTGGSFDVTVGSLVQLWRDAASSGELPAPDSLEKAVQSIGFRNVQLDDSCYLRPLAPGVSLDFGGIAKGFALDVAAAYLRQQGIQIAVLSAGTSTVLAIGKGPTGHGWSVPVRHPLEGSKVVAEFRLVDQALSTSANYERSYQIGRRRVGHIFDPRTGKPVNNGMLSATVITRYATQADALSTALFVMGPAEAVEFLRRHRLDGFLVWRQPDGRVVKVKVAGEHSPRFSAQK